MHVLLNCLIILGILLALGLLHIFIVALDKTIKEFRQSKPSGFSAGVGFGGDLGITHIKRNKSK
jgi:hypothetical protein